MYAKSTGKPKITDVALHEQKIDKLFTTLRKRCCVKEHTVIPNDCSLPIILSCILLLLGKFPSMDKLTMILRWP